MYLQNKQENGGGAPVTSPMLKSDQGIWRVKEFVFFSQECSAFLVNSSFMEEGRCPLFMGSRRFPSETEREGNALFACYDLFFLFDSQNAI